MNGRIVENASAFPIAEEPHPTKLAAFGAALAEHAWLAALIVAPLYFNLHSVRVFEEDKVPLLRSLSLIVVVGLAIWIGEGGRGAAGARASLLRVPLVRPALWLAVVYAGATLASTAPLTSLLGGYHRLQGAYTFASYLPFFLVPILLGAGARSAERAVSVALLGSLPVSLYAMVQVSGHDPMPWGGSFGRRVYSTAGNPIFLGAYLAMVIPLAVARLFERARGRRIAALGYLLLLVAQVIALVLSQSRGPFVGLAAGLAAFGLAWMALSAKRLLLLLAVAVLGALLALAAVFGLPGSRYELRGVARIFDVANIEGGSGRVRSLIWQASSDLILQSGVARLLIGHGPETELTALTPHYPPELGQYESRRTIPDRAHNEAIDATVATGLLGSSAEIALFIATFACLLGSLGLVDRTRGAIAFSAWLAGAVIAGVLVPYWLDGSLRFSGLGVHAALAAALLAFLAGRTLAGSRVSTDRDRSREFLLLGILGMMSAHVVEIGLGIPVAAPRLLFWTFCGLTAALASRPRDERVGIEETAPLRSDVSHACIGALVMIVLTVDAYNPSAKRDAMLFLLLAVGLPTWIAGAMLLRRWTGGWRRRFGMLASHVIVTTVPGISFGVLLVWWLAWQPALSGDPAAFVVRFARHVASAVTITYATIALLIVAAALFDVAAARPLPARLARSAGRVAAYALVAAAAVVLAVTQNLSVSHADVFAKQASFYEGRRNFDLAAALIEEAIRIRPTVDRYYSDLGREYIEQARATRPRDPAAADELLRRANGALRQALRKAPLMFDHARNLARLHRSWLDLADPGEAAKHVARADELYASASLIAPTSAPILNERALMHFSLKDYARARQLLDRSAEIDPGYPTTYWLRANLGATEGNLDAALADYDRALALEPWLAAALSGKGAVLTRLGRLDEAIAVNEKLLKYQPRDLIGRRNLAFLYREQGKNDEALYWAKHALRVAPQAERAALEAFIAEVAADLTRSSGG